MTEPDDDMPLDPDAHLFDDGYEGTDLDGTPITSIGGSEIAVWKDEADELPDTE